jgi:hypothetical protein
MQCSFQFESRRNKSSRHQQFAAIAALGVALAGCGNQEGADGSPLESVEQGALGVNALGVNALGVNALGVNALGVNALGVNALGVNALGVNGLNWLHESSTFNADRAQLLKYLTKCALGPGQFLPAHGAHNGCVGYPVYEGIYGLAPNWPTQGMTDVYEQRWVTACVLAHVNQHGTPQSLALHGVHSGFASTPAERATMYASEGRYWGNIFRPERWKNTCYSGGRNTGYDSPKNLDLILGRSCPDDGCGVMTANGKCPISDAVQSTYNAWMNYDYLYNMNGYSSYGYVYQPSQAGSTTPNSKGYFPTVEAVSPVSLEFEGVNGVIGGWQNCNMSVAYNNGIRSAATSDITAGVGSPIIGDCSSTAPCAGLDLASHPNGQKLRGLPNGLRLRYSFLTGEAVGSQQFYLKVRYSAATAGVQAKIGINGSVLTTVTFPSTGSWDNYDTIWWNVPFVATPPSLLSNTCGNGNSPGNIPLVVNLEVEVQPGVTFPDFDSIRLEP